LFASPNVQQPRCVRLELKGLLQTRPGSTGIPLERRLRALASVAPRPKGALAFAIQGRPLALCLSSIHQPGNQLKKPLPSFFSDVKTRPCGWGSLAQGKPWVFALWTRKSAWAVKEGRHTGLQKEEYEGSSVFCFYSGSLLHGAVSHPQRTVHSFLPAPLTLSFHSSFPSPPLLSLCSLPILRLSLSLFLGSPDPYCPFLGQLSLVHSLPLLYHPLSPIHVRLDLSFGNEKRRFHPPPLDETCSSALSCFHFFIAVAVANSIFNSPLSLL